MKTINCDFCGSVDLRLLYRVDTAKFHPDYLQAVSIVGVHPPEHFTVAECEKCGLVFLNPRYTGAELKAAYPDEQYNDRSGYFSGSILFKQSGVLPAVRLRGETVESKRNLERMERIHRFKKSGRSLDVGCCNGSFPALLQQYGWDAYGIDFSPTAIENARREFGQEQTMCGELLDAGYPDNYFDVVTMYDTIEHVPNPRAVLEEVKRISKPDALLVIQTNDFGSLNARLMPRSFIFPAQHLYYFRKKDLVRILCGLDFELTADHFSTIGPARYVYYFCMHWWTRFAVRLHRAERGRAAEGVRKVLQKMNIIFSHDEMLARLKMVGANNIPAFRADRTYYYLAQGQVQSSAAPPIKLVVEGGELR